MSVAALAHQLSLLPERLAWHIVLAVLALAVGIVVSLPLAIICTRIRALRGPALSIAGMIQTVPSLALLALMVLVFSTIGFLPAIIALVLYSILPILRNAVTGIAGVDPAAVEAARGVGMTDRQLLFKVQLPLAAPVIIAGIRTSAVWVVGIATLSTPVGQMSLGNYIFEGLQLRNNAAIAVGVISAALLAMLLDLLIHLMQLASEKRSLKLAMVSGVTLCALIGGGIAPLVNQKSEVIVGAKTFTEQYILADLISHRLDEAGFNAHKDQGMGSSILFDALCNGSVDCYVDYSGTIWANVMKKKERLPAQEIISRVTTYLKKQYGVECLGPLGFENTYALAMRRDRAEALGIKTIADLARVAPKLKIGGDYEFFGRPEWTAVQKMYGLHFAKTVALDSTLMYSAVKSGQVDVIAAFSTDGRIPAYNLVVLKDNQHAFPPYDALLLVSKTAATRPGFTEALRPMINSITDDQMRQANRRADVDGDTPVQAAKLLERRLRISLK
ncbi:MAG TPA: ABC transporter permease/substrate-binding protein [Tepidisphaeraceae bacterium]|nr:ABC transporter permease/substrate-binding protein [Tepidisphaeraceae bacterium]